MNYNDFLNNAHAFGKASELFDANNTERIPLYFLSDGYAVEYIITNGEKKIIRFINPEQFILRYSLQHGITIMADSKVLSLAWDKLVFMLRKFPDYMQDLHKGIKKMHAEQLQQYQNDLKRTPAERYFNLIENQPWVKQLAEPTEIASYLNLSVAQYEQFLLTE